MKLLDVWNRLMRQPTARELAEKELAEAHRSRLQALSGAEYAQSLATYHAQRIDRLEAFLAAPATELRRVA